MKAPAVFTIGASANFAECLAQGLLQRVGGDPLALSSAVIYLPTRRAARGFGEAFARVMGGAALLPQFKPLGDSDEDELLFDSASDGLDLLPAITPLRRQLLLAQLVQRFDIRERDGTLSFAQAAGLADSLAGVMDEVERQGADLGVLEDLLPGDMAAHWDGVARFLKILRDAWPKVLEDEKRLSPERRRTLVLEALAARLEASPPPGPVIAAGSTGSIPATARLLGVIARLPKGAVVLPGLDRALDDASWASLDAGHPQFGLRQLLSTIGCPRGDVTDWCEAAANPARETVLRETLRPAPTTDAWRALVTQGSGEIKQGLNNVALSVAADPAQEALAIALALRETLETPGRTAALVTPDRNLARRVAAQMARWGVTIDDSAGRPLAHAAAGSFLCLLADAVQARFAPVPLLALLKHPFSTLGQDAGHFRAHARELDRWCLRGPRPDPGLAGITAAIAKAGDARHAPPQDALTALASWWQDIAAILAPLEKIFAASQAPLDALLATHIRAAEQLACGASPDCPLWHGDDGRAAFDLVAELNLAAQGVAPIAPSSWPPLLRALAMKTAVRGTFGQHPRLFILGPLEARLQSFDLTVLGGLNEGSWPKAAGADPWFSRPMRKAIGLEQPERSIGQAAHDFAMLAAGPQVLMTRALKADGAPAIASRWLQRLQQLTAGLQLADRLTPTDDPARLAARLMEMPRTQPLAPPAPRPPVAVRPRKLSVTEIETWLRDPYAIYAKHILKLRPLDALDEAIGPLERGNALHKALELFVARHPGALADDAAEQLAVIADEVFAAAGIPKAALAIWRPRFLGAAQWFVGLERQRRPGLAASHLEIRGSRVFPTPAGDFTLSGVADRIDILKDGSAAILDYKSGKPPTGPQVQALLTPQLPLEAAILAADGFPGLGPRTASELLYVQLSGGAEAGKLQPVKGPQDLTAKAIAKFTELLQRYYGGTAPYLSRLQPFSSDSVGDYDHLARVREWSAGGEA